MGRINKKITLLFIVFFFILFINVSAVASSEYIVVDTEPDDIEIHYCEGHGDGIVHDTRPCYIQPGDFEEVEVRCPDDTYGYYGRYIGTFYETIQAGIEATFPPNITFVCPKDDPKEYYEESISFNKDVDVLLNAPLKGSISFPGDNAHVHITKSPGEYYCNITGDVTFTDVKNNSFSVLYCNIIGDVTITGGSNNGFSGSVFKGKIRVSNTENNTIGADVENCTTDGIILLNSHNNVLSGGVSNATGNGIILLNSHNNTIYASIHDATENGINLTNSHNNTIYPSVIDYNGKNGIFFEHSNNNSILHEEWQFIGFPLIASNKRNGILFNYSHNNTIDYVLVGANENGIVLNHSHDNTIVTLWILKNKNGILLEYSDKNTLKGFGRFFKAEKVKIENNTHSGIDLRDSNNNTISWFNITLNKQYGISLNSSDYNIIENNTVSYNNYTGIYLAYSTNNNISHNLVHHNANHTGDSRRAPPWRERGGICLEFSNRTFIINNSVYSNNATNRATTGGVIGINLLQNSHYHTIENNTVHSNGDDGINLNHISSNNNIINNTVFNNMDEGIHLYHDSASNNITKNTVYNNTMSGIALSEAGINNYVAYNRVFGARLVNRELANGNLRDFGNGIMIDHTEKVVVFNNTIYSNAMHGIHLWDAEDNRIYNDRIDNNNLAGSRLHYSTEN